MLESFIIVCMSIQLKPKPAEKESLQIKQRTHKFLMKTALFKIVNVLTLRCSHLDRFSFAFKRAEIPLTNLPASNDLKFLFDNEN